MNEPEASPGTRPSSSRIWWILLIAGVTAWFAYLAFLGPRSPRAGPVLEGTALSRPADYGWTLRDLDGQPVAFEKYRGKPIFLNIWATWCGPCVGELPSIARLAGSPSLAGVTFLCVATDDDPGAARHFLQGKDWPMTVLHARDLPAVFQTDGIPATFLIAADGKVSAFVLGSANWDEPSVVAFLERMSREPGGAAETGEKP